MRRAFLLFIALVLLISAKAQTPDEIPLPTNLRISRDKYGIYSYCEHEPTFPGGFKKFYKFVNENLKWPDESGMIDIQGRVFLMFVVEKNGSLSHIHVIRGLSSEFDAEAVRVMKLSPNWRPGTQNGRIVRVYYKMPILFTLSYK